MKTIFRRVHGRLIPIKINDDVKEGAKAGGLVGAGLATGIATGLATAKLDLKHHALTSVARNVGMRAGRYGNAGKAKMAFKAVTMQAKLGLEANRYLKTSLVLNAAGKTVAASLIGAGVNKILNQTKLKNDPEIRGTIATASGVAATFAIHHAYAERFLKNQSSFKAAGRAAMAIVKKAATKLI